MVNAAYIYITCFNVRILCVFLTDCNHVLLIVLTSNSSYFPDNLIRLVFVIETLCVFFEVPTHYAVRFGWVPIFKGLIGLQYRKQCIRSEMKFHFKIIIKDKLLLLSYKDRTRRGWLKACVPE